VKIFRVVVVCVERRPRSRNKQVASPDGIKKIGSQRDKEGRNVIHCGRMGHAESRKKAKIREIKTTIRFRFRFRFRFMFWFPFSSALLLVPHSSSSIMYWAHP
jgi:hypothetical protein